MQLPLFPSHVFDQWRYNLLKVELLKAQEELQKVKYSQRSYKGNATKRKKMIDDILLEKAIGYAEDHKGCSLEGLIRAFGIGRNKAYMLLDIMEREGVVEPFDGNLFRKFLSKGKNVFNKPND